ncbi:MAG: beta-glycosidase [Rikenellaceae bacterium]|jgi:glucosylceramidase|nr:beta-glycosidase [Rikenellaceae bacterium]
MKNLILIFLTCFSAVACGRSAQWVASTADVSWEVQEPTGVQFVRCDSADAEVDAANPQQTIEGFGACFNELGWTSLGALGETDRETIMRELFAPGVGANFTVCRMPVGANDFSRDWYSYNETDGDFAMTNFSIDNDRETLVPFIKNAQKYNPELKIWASPWSPPTWMKDNKHYACQPLDASFFDPRFANDLKPEQRRAEGMNMFIQSDDHMKAYALYFAKFIEAYRDENIPIFMVMPQNEFNSCQPFPSCTWQASALARFVGQHLGPKMEELGVEVMFGTMERPNPALVDTLLRDPASSRYIRGVGFQWAGKHSIASIHERYPSLKLYQTEQECGNGRNDWRLCRYSWTLLKHYLDNGACVYDYWNISLEGGGMSRWGWRQNSLVTVDREAKSYKLTYEYYLMKHVSHYVRPGAVCLPVSGKQAGNTLAFRNADGSLVLVLHNDAEAAAERTVRIGDRAVRLTLKPDSFNTVIL